MSILLKGLREGLGRLIVLGDCIFNPKQTKRDKIKQQEFDKKCESLELYQFYACPFCIKVRRSIRRLNLNIQTRDAQRGEYRQELLEKTGKIQVPCLKITTVNKEEWIYDSDDIIKYLEDNFQ